VSVYHVDVLWVVTSFTKRWCLVQHYTVSQGKDLDLKPDRCESVKIRPKINVV